MKATPVEFFGIVGCHVGKVPEDVKVSGISCGRKKNTTLALVTPV